MPHCAAVLRRLVGYTAVMFGASTVTGLLSFAVNALGMSLLTKDTYGDYATYVLIYSVGQGFFIFGVNQCIQREASDDPIARLRFIKLAYLGFAALLVLCLMAAVPVAYVYDGTLALGVVALPFVVVAWWCRYVVRSQLDAKREAFFNSIASLGTTVFQLGFLLLSSYTASLVYGDFLAQCAAAIIPMMLMPQSQGVTLREILRTPIPREFLRRNFEQAKPNWLSGQVSVAAQTFTMAWSRATLGAAALGSLSAMNMIWNFALKPMDQLAQAALPGLVTAKERRGQLHRELMVLCMVAFPMLGAGVALGTPLLLEVLKLREKYGELPPFIIVMAAAVPMGVFQMIHNQLAVARGDSRFTLYGQLGQLVGVGLATVTLMGPFGLMGGVIAGAVGVAVNAAVLFWCMRDDPVHDVRLAARWTVLGTIGVVLAMLPYYPLRHERWVWVTALLVPVLYGAAMMLFRVLTVADLRRVWGLVQARRAARAARA